jgi:general secretion pathway protein J
MNALRRHRSRWRSATPAAGFTLVELVIALAIVGALLVIAFGGLRVVLGATERGERRVEVHQHVRSMATLLARSVGAAYPYKGPMGENPEARLLFQGAASKLEFVTQAPPFPLAAPVAFTAVVLEYVEEQGLIISERPLPNWNPFTEAAVVLRDPAVTALSFRYMDTSGSWQSTWDDENSTPAAIEITAALTLDGRPEPLPPMVVQPKVTPPQ